MNVGTLTFLWPTLLWLLLALPLAVALAALRTRSVRSHAAVARLETVDSVGGSRVRRTLTALLWVAGLAALLLAIARPQAALTLPSRIETVILAIDMSGSMRGTDIAPTRMVAAQNAAKAFVAEQPRHVKVGVVGIAASAAVVQSPTTNRDDIAQALDRLEPQRGTALGSGLVIALDAALPQARIDVEAFINPRPGRPPATDRSKPDDDKSEPGSSNHAAIVLLSDGQSNVGPDPLKAAELAAAHGVRIYAVGMGTPGGAIVSADGWSMRVGLDEEKLKRVARVTEGEYFRAADAAELKKVYARLGTKLAFEKQQPTEITALFAALGALAAGLGAVLSLAWFNRVL
jgi:Ca-activated chloride channel family protein